METVDALILLKVVLINLVLSGDNALVIALVCRKLPAEQRNAAFLWGSLGAVVCKILLTFVALQVLQVPLLQAAGALLLIWIALKLFQSEEEGRVRQHDRMWRAVMTIVAADVVMSLDNTVAVAAVAKDHLLLIGIGLAVSIPVIIWGANVLVRLMSRFPLIVWAGAMLLGYTAGEMLIEDRLVGTTITGLVPAVAWLLPWVVALGVLLIGLQRARRDVKVVRKLERVSRVSR